MSREKLIKRANFACWVFANPVMGARGKSAAAVAAAGVGGKASKDDPSDGSEFFVNEEVRK